MSPAKTRSAINPAKRNRVRGPLRPQIPPLAANQDEEEHKSDASRSSSDGDIDADPPAQPGLQPGNVPGHHQAPRPAHNDDQRHGLSLGGDPALSGFDGLGLGEVQPRDRRLDALENRLAVLRRELQQSAVPAPAR